jgi:hypothetical protein
MSFEQKPPRFSGPGERDPSDRLAEYAAILCTLVDKFKLAKKYHIENSKFKHVLFDFKTDDSHQKIATFALAKSFEEVVRQHEPVIEITIPVDTDETALAETKLADADNVKYARFSIRNKMSTVGIFEVTFDDFDSLLDQEISSSQSNDLLPVPHQTYRDLIYYGVPIPLRQPTPIL